MKTITTTVYSLLLLTFISASAFGNEETQSGSYTPGEVAYFAYRDYDTVSKKGVIAAKMSNGYFVIKLDEPHNGRDYLTSTHPQYLYHAERCTTQTDDGSEICGGSTAISLDHGRDCLVLAVNEYQGLSLIMIDDELIIINTKLIISSYLEE